MCVCGEGGGRLTCVDVVKTAASRWLGAACVERLITSELQDTPAAGSLHAKSASSCTSAVQARVRATHRASVPARGANDVLYHARVPSAVTPALLHQLRNIKGEASSGGV